ncbi:unnamed protein product, partial [Staurois parvus]
TAEKYAAACFLSKTHTANYVKQNTVNPLIAPDVNPFLPSVISTEQGRTDNSWGPRAIGDHGGPCVLTHTQTTPKKAYERYQGHLMGPPTDPGPLGRARVPKWSVRPW